MDNEFLIELQAILDEAKSKGNINSDIDSIQGQVDKLKLQAEIDPKSISNIVKQLESVLNQKITISNIDINPKNVVKTGQQTGQQIGNAINQGVKQGVNDGSQALETLKIRANTVKNELDKFTNKNPGFSNWSKEIDGVTVNVESLKSELDTVDNSADFKNITAKINNLKSSFTLANKETVKFATETSRLNKVATMQKWADNNTKAMKKFGNEISALINEMGNLDKAMTLDRSTEITNKFKSIQNMARETGNLGMTFSDKMKNAWEKFGGWTLASGSMMKVWTTLKQMPKDVTTLDTALVDLRKTAKMSASELENFYYSSNDVAKDMNATTEEILNQAAAWSRLGYSTDEQATKMAKYSSMFKSISPNMDIDSATNGLVSVMKAFKIGAEDVDEVVDGIMSKVNIIGNTRAVNNTDIVEILRRSSSAMAEANNTLEDTIALGTAITEITRDAANAGQVLKTTSMRIRGYDEETEEYIGGIEELSGKIADFTKTAKTPGGITLFTDETKTEFKSTRELFGDIAEIYQDLTDKQQAGLLEALAGKRNGQAVAAILNNYDAVEKSLESMSNSAGSAEAEMAIVMDSIDYKMNRLKETGVGISQNLFNRDDIKIAIDGLTSVAEAVDWLTDKLGLFGTLGAGAGLFAGFNNIGNLYECTGSKYYCFEYALHA